MHVTPFFSALRPTDKPKPSLHTGLHCPCPHTLKTELMMQLGSLSETCLGTYNVFHGDAEGEVLGPTEGDFKETHLCSTLMET